VRGRRARHIVAVHRAQPGTGLRVGVIGGRVGRATVVRVGDEEVELEVMLEAGPPPPLPLTLVLALPRPKVLRRVLGAAAAFGIKRIVLFGACRVEKSYRQRPLAGEAAIREELLVGLEQARDTVLPSVEQRRLFRPFVEDELATLAAGSRLLVAHPGEAADCPRAVTTPVTLVVGPEGGFVDFELALLGKAGARAVSLGARPLRVEHAVAALLGRLF
jgi:RsmE family RNA methyltransferase